MYLFLDAHPYFEDPMVLRAVKDIALAYDRVPRLIVFLSPKLEAPAELSRLAARFEPRLPDQRAIAQIVREEAARLQMSTGSPVGAQREALHLLVQHLIGLTEEDVRRMVQMSIRDDGKLTLSDLGRVLKAKHEFLQASEILALEPGLTRLEEVGGLDQLKRWLEVRREAFLAGDAEDALPPPKGVLLLGVQGAGKSLAAKAVAGAWNLPLFRLDFGTLYNKFHGETERNLREALRIAGAMAPCVLWIDEIEKAIAGDAAGDSDGGVSRRLLGTLLTWMAERADRVFLVATANDIQRLPPELLRKGRFDEIFFVDLPDAGARSNVLRIHLTKRKLDPGRFDLDALASACEGFSGAEIEQAIVSALYETRATKVDLDAALIMQEMQRTRPLSVVMAEQVAALRQWAASRTVPAG